MHGLKWPINSTRIVQVVQHGERGWRMWYTGNGFGRTGMGFAEGVEELTEAVGSYPPNAGLQLSTSANTGTTRMAGRL